MLEGFKQHAYFSAKIYLFVTGVVGVAIMGDELRKELKNYVLRPKL